MTQPMKKILFSHSLLAKNKSALNGSKLMLASRFLYMSTEVTNSAGRVKGILCSYITMGENPIK